MFQNCFGTQNAELKTPNLTNPKECRGESFRKQKTPDVAASKEDVRESQRSVQVSKLV